MQAMPCARCGAVAWTVLPFADLQVWACTTCGWRTASRPLEETPEACAP